MIRRPPRSTRTDNSFPTRRSSDLLARDWNSFPALSFRLLPGPRPRTDIRLGSPAAAISVPIRGGAIERRAFEFVELLHAFRPHFTSPARRFDAADRAHRSDPITVERKRARPYAPSQCEAAYEIASEDRAVKARSEEHTSELQSLMRISYAAF